MGLNEALKRYGTMPLAEVIAPAIALAEKGYVLLPGDVKILDNRTEDFATEPNVAAIFLNDGRPFVAGERLVQTRSEEHTSELQSLMRNSYAVFCLKKKKDNYNTLQMIHNISKR